MHPDQTSSRPEPAYDGLFLQPTYRDGRTWHDAVQDTEADEEQPAGALEAA